MGRRADVVVSESAGLLQFNGAGSSYLVQTLAGVLYYFFVDTASDLCYRKSSDGGLSWGNQVQILGGTLVAFAVWYDRWSGIAADLIHLAYTDGADGDVKYRTIDTASADALSTQTVVFAGASSAANGHLSIARARGGNVYVKATIDAGVEGGFFRLPNANVPNGAWDAARANPEALATLDMGLLAPGFAADNQDMLLIYWDASANQVSRYIYDDSANTWAESIFTGTFTEQAASTAWPHFALAVDLTNSRLFVVAWNAIDTANADLTAWTVTESAITALTDVVTNSTDDQGLCAISYDTQTGRLTVFYGGASGGAETYPTAINIYCKGSNDNGSTWGAETKLTLAAHNTTWLACCPRQFGAPVVAYYDDGSVHNDVSINVDRMQPSASFGLGLT